MSDLPAIKPLATMEEAWAEHERLWDESDRLWAEHERLWVVARLVVTRTAESLYGEDAVVDWAKRTVKARNPNG